MSVGARQDLEVPICNPETALITPGDNMPLGGLDAFTRPVKLEIPGRWEPESLDKVLSKTDEELEKIAKNCGVLVVEHEWYLYPTSGKDENAYAKYVPLPSSVAASLGLLPPGHILAAKVDTVGGLAVSRDDFPELEQRIQKGIDEYRDENNTAEETVRPVRLTDLRVDQCMSDTRGGVFYVDIEPRFI